MFAQLCQEDRDGELQIVTASQDFTPTVLDRRIRIVPSGTVGWESTEGDSAENGFWGVGLYAQVPVVDRLLVFGQAAWRERDFEEQHVRARFLDERRDQERNYGAGVLWSFTDRLYATFEWRHTNNDSSLSEHFSYEQNDYQVTLTFRY